MKQRDDGFFLSEHSSKRRLRDAENARNNRAEIMKAYSTGQVSRRELVKWGLFTSAGLLAPIGGLSPFVSSAHAQALANGTCSNNIPTGMCPSPLFGVQPFSTPMPRFDVFQPVTSLTPAPTAEANTTQQLLDPLLVNGQSGLTGPI